MPDAKVTGCSVRRLQDGGHAMSRCTGKPHANGQPCRGVQTIPPECFKCGTIQHFGFDVDYYPDELPHWQCQHCHGGYWFWTPDGSDPRVDRAQVGLALVHRGDVLVARFDDEDAAKEYIDWQNSKSEHLT